MKVKEKISQLLAENYFQAASSDCDMFRITDILEEVRSMEITFSEIIKLEDRLELRLGENIANENEFHIIQRLLDQIRQLKRENYKHEITEILKKDEGKGWLKWMEIFAVELTKTSVDNLNFLLTLKIPEKYQKDFRKIKRLTAYLTEERWPESLPLIQIFIENSKHSKTIKADLHMMAGQIHLYHFWDMPKTMEHFKKVKMLLPESAKAERVFGEYCIQNKDFKKGREHLQKALDFDKKDFENYLVLGNLYKAENRYETAESWYNEGIIQNPGKADLYNRLLLLNEHPAHYKNHSSDIDNLIEQIIKLDNNFTYTALSNAGFVHQKNSNFEKAEEYYGKVLDLFPNRVQANTNLGYSFLDKNDLKKAEELFKKSIEIDKNAFDGYWGMVALNRIKEDWKALISNLTTCERIRPEWLPFFYYDYGNGFEKLKELDKSRKYYLLALQHDPQKTLGLSALLDMAELDLDFKTGIALMEEIKKIIGPESEERYYYRKGVIYYKNQGYKNAVECFEKAKNTIEDDPVKLEYAGLAYEKTGNHKKAEETYRKAINSATANKNKYYNRLAFYFTNQNRCREAIELLNKAIAIKQEPLYFENRGYAHELLGEIENAEINYKKALELADNNKDIYENRLGIYFYRLRNYKKAIEHYNKAIEFYQKPVYFENIGLAYERSGEIKNAEQSYRKAVECAAHDKDKYLNRLGFFLSGLGKHNEAIRLLEEAIQINKVPTYLENLGFSLEKLGQLKEAEKNYTKALEISSGQKDIYLNRLGIFNYNQKKYEDAILYYRQAIDENPKAVYYENLGNAYKDSGNFALFEDAYQKAAKIEPHNGIYYFQLGWRTLIELKDTKKSKQYLNKALKIFRETPEIEPEELLSIQYLGAAYQQEGNLEKAEEIFKEAYTIDSDNDLICNFLGKVYLDKKEYKKALEFYNKALTLNPDKMSNYQNVAETYEILGETKKELETYKNGARVAPVLHQNIGKIYFKNKDYENAKKHILLALETEPENFISLEYLGLLMQKFNRYKEAVQIFGNALKFAPEGEKDVFLNYQGNCWYALNNFEKAATLYQEAINLNPANKVYFENLILALKSGNQKDEVKELIEKKLETEPDNSNLINQLGLLFFEEKNYEKAIECFKQNIKINPSNAIAHDNLGFAYEKLNQPEKAIEAYMQGIPYDNSFNEKIGKIYFNNKDYESAEIFIRKAHEAAPENEVYLSNLGIVLAYQNKLEEAEKVYLELLSKWPENQVYNDSLTTIRGLMSNTIN